MAVNTLAQAKSQYLSNADYAEDLSVAKAKRFVTACRALLVHLPSSATKGANSAGFRVDLIAKEMEMAQAWLEKHDSDQIPGPLVTRSDFRNFRG